MVARGFCNCVYALAEAALPVVRASRLARAAERCCSLGSTIRQSPDESRCIIKGRITSVPDCFSRTVQVSAATFSGTSPACRVVRSISSKIDAARRMRSLRVSGGSSGTLEATNSTASAAGPHASTMPACARLPAARKPTNASRGERKLIAASSSLTATRSPVHQPRVPKRPLNVLPSSLRLRMKSPFSALAESPSLHEPCNSRPCAVASKRTP